MKLSTIIPCYNEEKNIPILVDRIRSLNVNTENFEFIFVNNGSTDNSEKVLLEVVGSSELISVVKVIENIGYGHGILSGLKIAKGDFLGWTHADLQTDLGDVVKAFNILEEESFHKELYVKGDRKGRPFFDQIFTSGMSAFESVLMLKRMCDINAQPNFFHRSFYDSWQDPPYDFSLDLYALYLAKVKKMKIIRFPVLFTDRLHGESHWNTSLANKWKFIKRTVNFSFKLKKRMNE